MKKIKVHQHHVTLFLNCRQRFNLSENWCITSRFKKKELNLGSAFHAGVREYKKGNKDFLIEGYKYFNDLHPENQEEINQIQWGKAVVTSMIMGYSNKYQSFENLIDVERKLSQSISDRIRLIGTPDSIEGSWIGEEKTTQRLDQDYVKKLLLDFQMSFYFLLTRKFYRKKFDGIIYRITRVTSLRQKKGQTWDNYLKEIANDYMTRPEWYFVYEKLYRSNDDMERFKNELIMQINDIMDCYKTKRWYKNTRICSQYGCEFMNYCLDPTQDTLNTYYTNREDLDKCFSIINKMKVADRPTLSGTGTYHSNMGTTTPDEKVSPDLPF